MYELKLTHSEGVFSYRTVEDLTLREQEGSLPFLNVRVLSDAPDAEVRKLIATGRVEFLVEVGATQRTAFRGIVRRVKRQESSLVLDCSTNDLHHGAIKHTRTFSSNQCEPLPISQLTGATQVFSQVRSLNRLDAVVHCVSQIDETNLRLLRRLCFLSGQSLLCDSDGLKIQRPDEGTLKRLASREIVRGSVKWEMELQPDKCEQTEWNLTTGQKQQATATLKDNTLFQDVLQAARVVFLKPEEDFPLTLPENQSPALAAGRSAAVREGLAFQWSAAVLDPELRPGHRVELPESEVTQTPLRVIRRTLRYLPGQQPEALLNFVELRSETALLSPPRHKPMAVHQGEVVHTQDADQLGRVAVRLPWQTPGNSVFAQVLPPFIGAVVAPKQGDHVMVLIPGDGVSCPIVLGAIHQGSQPASVTDSNDVIVWELPEGLRVRLNRRESSIEFSILTDGEPVTRIFLTANGVEITGDVTLLNNLIYP